MLKTLINFTSVSEPGIEQISQNPEDIQEKTYRYRWIGDTDVQGNMNQNTILESMLIFG